MRLGKCRAILFFAALSLLSHGPLRAAQRPRLVVEIIIDQFRSDYLLRFGDQLLPPVLKNGAPGGFRYFAEKGAYFPMAQTGHGINVTAAGHATISTGGYPYTHGMISNRWWDRSLGREVYALEDADAPLVSNPSGPKESGRSPRKLLSTALADEIKTAFGGKSIVASLSMKDRAAILMGGHRPDLALWYDEKKQVWTSSAYYRPDGTLPAFLNEWNNSKWVARNVPRAWELSRPKTAYAFSTAAPGEKAYQDCRGIGLSFPHPIDPSTSAFLCTPWSASYLLDTAIEVVEKMGMGKDDVTDLLAVSVSAFDIAGHSFGPNSEEMQDFLYRQDVLLSDFSRKLKEALPHGLNDVVFVLTADHGVTEAPAVARSVKLPISSIVPEELEAAISSYLIKTFGLPEKSRPVHFVGEGNLFLNEAAFSPKRLEISEVARKTAQWMSEQPCIGLAHSRWEFRQGQYPRTHFSERLARSVHPSRSGDVIFSPASTCAQFDHHGILGAEHGNVYAHDASLPILFAGAQFKPGKYYDPATLADIAPTLAAVIGTIPPTGAEGRVLKEALK